MPIHTPFEHLRPGQHGQQSQFSDQEYIYMPIHTPFEHLRPGQQNQSVQQPGINNYANKQKEVPMRTRKGKEVPMMSHLNGVPMTSGKGVLLKATNAKGVHMNCMCLCDKLSANKE